MQRVLANFQPVVLRLQPKHEILRACCLESTLPSISHEPKPLLLVEHDLAMDVHLSARMLVFKKPRHSMSLAHMLSHFCYSIATET